jgi:hypothetical protein
MHGRQWHDHDEPKDFELEVMAGEGAAPEVESGGDRAGIGRLKVQSATSPGHVKRKRTTPVGKGPKTKRKPAAAKQTATRAVRRRSA